MKAREFLKRGCNKAHRTEVMQVIYEVRGMKARTILEQRYIMGCSWRSISVMTDLNMAWVRRIHNEALKSVQSILDSKTEYSEES